MRVRNALDMRPAYYNTALKFTTPVNFNIHLPLNDPPMKTLPMKKSAVLLAAAFTCVLLPKASHANLNNVLGSNVNAYFGSQNDGFQDRFPLSLPPAWFPVGPGPYPITQTFLIIGPGFGPPPANAAPSNVTPFSGPGSFSSFADSPGNNATSLIQGFIGGPGDFIDDAQIGLIMSINQVGSSSYAYEQIDYSIDYDLLNSPNTQGFLSGVLPGIVTRSFSVSGVVNNTPGSYAQFGGEMNFFSVLGSTPTSMGTLNFSYLNLAGGAFSTVVTSSATIGTVPVDNPDFIRITGSFYVAGDPSSITVKSVPEPTALALLGIGAVGLLKRDRRRA